MMKKTIPCFCFFVIVLVSDLAALDVHIVGGLSAGATLTGVEGFDTAFQPNFGIEGGALFAFHPSCGLYAGLRQTWTSEAYIGTSGWLYRGYRATSLEAAFSYTCPKDFSLGRMRGSWGMQAGPAASIAVYSLADQYFFYPSLFIEPFAQVRLPDKAVGFRVSAPLSWNFMADRDISFEGELSLGIVIIPKLLRKVRN